tara:strand:- start:3261 stop:3605 length:345 start_codon:yes stop_codon:yes gene_type:complete
MQAPTFTEIAVVGMYFRDREGVPATELVAGFIPPVQLQFERDFYNQYDENAIKVLYQGQHIGFLEAAQAIFLAPWLDDGHNYELTVTDMQVRRKNLHPIVTATPLPMEQKQADE